MKTFSTIVGLLSICFTISANAKEVSTLICLSRTGLMNATLTQVKLEKQQNGYTAYLTAASGDVGPQWKIDNEKVAENLNCKFSNVTSAFYCSNEDANWNTLQAAKSTFEYVDQTTGEDKILLSTDIILSGTSPVLKKFKHSVFKFSATECTQN